MSLIKPDMSKSTIFATLLILFPCLFSCTGTVDDNNTVPEGVLRIFVDGSTTIKADGTDKVVFRVMYGAEDVSTSISMNLIREYEEDDSRLDAGVNEFSTTTPGTYIFTARYYDGAAVFTDNSVTVTALPVGDAETSEWSQKVLAVQFTSTTCIGCPALSSAIRQLQSENPDMLYPVAFHMDYQGPDPMAIPASSTFANHFIGTNVILPALFYNLHQPHGQQMNNSFSVIRSELETELASYVPSCGISVASEYDEASGTVTVTAGIKSNIQQVCRLVVFLVEDDIVYQQLDDPDYVHDNVVRAVLTNGVSGDPVNNRLPLYPGTECVVTKTAQLSDEWNPDNMRVVAAVLVQTEDGQSYRSDNVNACVLDGGISDYQIDE